MKALGQIITVLVMFNLAVKAQDTVKHKLPKLTVNDRSGGYTLYTYDVPQDGYYVFSVNGGLLPKNTCTIYYCEYQLELRSGEKVIVQEQTNIASQAQDGNICHFDSNEKDNTIGGIFNKGEKVELRLLMHKSDVNGQPHKELSITGNSLVLVNQVSPVAP